MATNGAETLEHWSLLIMACPYCGSPDVHEINRIEGHQVETVAVSCLTCDESFVIDRSFYDEDSEVAATLLKDKDARDEGKSGD